MDLLEPKYMRVGESMGTYCVLKSAPETPLTINTMQDGRVPIPYKCHASAANYTYNLLINEYKLKTVGGSTKLSKAKK